MARIKELKEIPLSDLEIGKGQVRTREVGKEIDELADSIRKIGLLEPIVVSESKTPGKYEIITGQRRFLAHQELKKKTIQAMVIDEHVDETTAKTLSLTENLVRRNLNQRDLVDVCTYLYRKYGTIQAVVDETGLPYSKVNQYVKFDQLIPPLKEMVQKGELKLPIALRAQMAAGAGGKINPKEAVQFAKEMTTLSGTQQKKMVEQRMDDPSASADEVIEGAKSGAQITQLRVTLTSRVHRGLKQFADEASENVDDAAASLIESALSDKGFLGD